MGFFFPLSFFFSGCEKIFALIFLGQFLQVVKEDVGTRLGNKGVGRGQIAQTPGTPAWVS